MAKIQKTFLDFFKKKDSTCWQYIHSNVILVTFENWSIVVELWWWLWSLIEIGKRKALIPGVKIFINFFFWIIHLFSILFRNYRLFSIFTYGFSFKFKKTEIHSINSFSFNEISFGLWYGLGWWCLNPAKKKVKTNKDKKTKIYLKTEKIIMFTDNI